MISLHNIHGGRYIGLKQDKITDIDTQHINNNGRTHMPLGTRKVSDTKIVFVNTLWAVLVDILEQIIHVIVLYASWWN